MQLLNRLVMNGCREFEKEEAFYLMLPLLLDKYAAPYEKIIADRTGKCAEEIERACAIAGICLISFNDSIMELNPAGDLPAIIAAFTWTCYSVLTRKISRFGYPVIQTTRRIFFRGILFMIPTLFFFPFHFGPERFSNPVYLLNILFPGLCASALCFVTWNFAVSTLGAVKTSIYIYMVPVITVITSLIILQKKITGLSALGVLLTLAGLIISEGRLTFKKRGHFHEFTK